MTARTPSAAEYSSTGLSLSSGAELFDNAGVRRLRQAVEDEFVRLHLNGGICAIGKRAEFGDLPDLLGQAAQTLEKGQRLVLDLRSPAHWAASAVEAGAWREDPDVVSIDVLQLAPLATGHGLLPVAVEPYAALWDNALLFQRLAHRFKWLRLLSWLERDEALFQLGWLLDREVFARLGCSASGRYLVALEKGEAGYGGSLWQRIVQRDASLGDPALEGLPELLSRPFEELAELARPCMAGLRVRHLTFILLQALEHARPGFDCLQWLDADVAAQLCQWRQALDVDVRAMAIVKDWAGDGELRLRDGVDLVSGVDYNLVRALLHGYFHTHSGVTS